MALFIHFVWYVLKLLFISTSVNINVNNYYYSLNSRWIVAENFQSCVVVRSRLFHYSLRLKRTVIIIVLLYMLMLLVQFLLWNNLFLNWYNMDLMDVYAFVWLSHYSLLRVVNTAWSLQEIKINKWAITTKITICQCIIQSIINKGKNFKLSRL